MPQIDSDLAKRAEGGEATKPLEDMAIFDDLLFGEALKGRNGAVAEIAQTVLEDPKLTVAEARTQHAIGNVGPGSVRLDILAIDGQGRRINVEFQRENRGAGIRRANRNALQMAAELARSGFDPGALPEIYVVFFTEHDYWKLGQTIYNGELMMSAKADPQKCNSAEVAPFEADDGLHIIYVNCAGQKDLGTPIGRLIHDLFSKTSKGMYFPHLAEALRDCKETPEGRRKMESVIEAYMAKGANDRAAIIAMNMLADGQTTEKTAQYAELPLSEVERLRDEVARRQMAR